MIVISVEDTGIGISPMQLDKLFTESVDGYFYREERDYRGIYRILNAQIQERARTPFYDQLKNYVWMAKDQWHTPGHSSGESLRGSPWVNDFYEFMGEHVFDADLSRLIQLYVVGVFTSFTFGQAGMVRHWNRLLASGTVSAERRGAVVRSRAINAVGATLTGLVARVALTQTFGNRFDQPLEASYIFPLPDRAADVRFHAAVDSGPGWREVTAQGDRTAAFQRLVAQARPHSGLVVEPAFEPPARAPERFLEVHIPAEDLVFVIMSGQLERVGGFRHLAVE